MWPVSSHQQKCGIGQTWCAIRSRPTPSHHCFKSTIQKLPIITPTHIPLTRTLTGGYTWLPERLGNVVSSLHLVRWPVCWGENLESLILMEDREDKLFETPGSLWYKGFKTEGYPVIGLPRWYSDEQPTFQCRRHKRHGFNPWVGKIPWSRKWQPILVFLPGKFHGQRSLVVYSPWCHRVRCDWAHTCTYASCD